MALRFLALLLLTFCTAQLRAADAGRPGATGRGTTFTVPAGWSMDGAGARITLRPPETDSRILIVESQAADLQAALADLRPHDVALAGHAIKLITARPGRNGWDELQVVDYEVSPNEKRALYVRALRSGKNWTLALTDGSNATLDKRAAPLSLLLQSIRPAGFTRESFKGKAAHALDDANILQLKGFLAESMAQLGIPGLSFALIDANGMVYEGGLGVRQLDRADLVDANTLFMAASNTKSMTTLLMSELVDANRMRWDQPVTELYPTFQLGDAATTRKVLIRHLICACTGLPRQDLEMIFNFKDSTPLSAMTALRKIQPTTGFGEVFQYSNQLASAAGYVAANIIFPHVELGRAYDTAMQDRIFNPLGMKSTTFDMARALKGNHAAPHAFNIDGVPAPVDMRFNYVIHPYRPAGGVWTSARDLIRYVQLELLQGKLPNGRQLVSAENLLMRRRSQVAVGENRTYGMGLETDSTWGVPVVHHGGSLAGYKSDIYLLPDYGVGAVLLTNSDSGQYLLRPFMRRLLEVLFDGKPEAAADVAAQAARIKAEIATTRKRLILPAAANSSVALATHYRNADLGDIVVQRTAAATVFDFGEWSSPVASRNNDDGTLSLVTVAPAVDGFDFVVGARAGTRTLTIRDEQHEYVFSEIH